VTTLDTKDPDRDAEYAIDARRLAYAEMRRDWPYEAGAFVKSPRHTGFYYECTTAGETKHNWPDLPRAANQTVADGSVVWTARLPSAATLPTISTVTWDVDPAGELAVDSERIEGGIVYPTLTGGVDGESYELTAHVTWSNGQVDDVTVTIPVAHR
jgi:hypothetical protein